MRTKVTLVLLFLNVVLFFVIFRFERSWRTEHVAMEVRRRVLGPETGDIRTLDVSSSAAGRGSYSLVRRGESWFLTKPIEWRANMAAVDGIVRELKLLENKGTFLVDDVVKNGQTLADYGLDHPQLTVTFTSGGPDTTGGPAVTTTFWIGESTKVGQRRYLLSPDRTRIHVVGPELADDLSIPIEQLRADTILTIPVYEATALYLQSTPPAGVQMLIQHDAGRWRFVTPIPARAGKDAVELAINNLDGLHVKRFLDGDQAPPPAQLRVTVSGNGRQETLFFGPEAADSSVGSSESERVAWIEDSSKPSGRSALFTVIVEKDFLKDLGNALDKLRDRHILDFDPTYVTGVTLRHSGQPDLSLQRDPGLPADALWQIVQRGDGTQGPSTLPADRVLVQHLIDELAQLSVLPDVGFKNDAPQDTDIENWGLRLPERTISVNLQPPGSGGSVITLEIGQTSPRDPFAYARLEDPPSPSVYTVSTDILTDTPVTALSWRDRSLSPLPAAAKITGVTLTDTVDNKVLFDWSDSAQAAGPPDKAALTNLLGYLRNLRASRFVQDSFPKTVRVDGVERPWRYRLDARIALPSGAGGDQTSVRTLAIAERTGGTEQLAGSADCGAVFVLEQGLVDDLWKLTYGSRDPGSPPPAKP